MGKKRACSCRRLKNKIFQSQIWSKIEKHITLDPFSSPPYLSSDLVGKATPEVFPIDREIV
jgi:hypothetical protein